MPQQVASNPALVVDQTGRDAPPREWKSEVEMQAGCNTLLPGNVRCSLRVLHKYHCTHRGNCTLQAAVQNAVCRNAVTAPIVRIYDQKTSLRCHCSRPRRNFTDFIPLRLPVSLVRYGSARGGLAECSSCLCALFFNVRIMCRSPSPTLTQL